jgi:hypothetical protein
MNEYKRILIAVVLFSCFCLKTEAQTERLFKGSLILGGNASQMDGDEAIGYNLLGLRVGLRASLVLKENMSLSLDMLYSQRGSKSTRTDFVSDTVPFVFRLNYLEVPVVFHYGDWEIKEANGNKYYKMVFCGGLAYSRLFSTDVDVFIHATKLGRSVFLNALAKDDMSWLLGVDFNFTAHLGLEARFTKSLNQLFDAEKYAPLTDLNSLKGYYFSMQGVYTF